MACLQTVPASKLPLLSSPTSGRCPCRYDQLRQQLYEAQELASEEEQQRVVAAATQAISRLGEALNPAGLSSAQRVVQAITEDAQVRMDIAQGRPGDARCAEHGHARG